MISTKVMRVKTESEIMLANLIARNLSEKLSPAVVEGAIIKVFGIHFGEIIGDTVLWIPIAAQPLTLYSCDPEFFIKLDDNIDIAILDLKDIGDSYAREWFRTANNSYTARFNDKSRS